MSTKVEFSTKPLYLQVHDVLLERILSGHWQPGKSIPNETDLARELSVSIGTVRRALANLESEHVIWRQQGRGTFVADQNDGDHVRRLTCLRNELGQPVDDSVDILEQSETTAEEGEIHHLQLAPGAKILKLTRVRSTGGKPFFLEQVSLPQTRFPGLSIDEPIPTQIAALAQRFGHMIAAAEEEVSATVAGKTTSSRLGVRPGTPLLKLDRTVYATDGLPVEWRSGLCHLDKIRYCVSLE